MTKDKIMWAAKLRKPVVCKGIRYSRISAVIFRYMGGSDIMQMSHSVPSDFIQVELEDTRARSRTIANPSQVELAEK